jgi:alkyl hydroperoxide reductase subunit AhpC
MSDGAERAISLGDRAPNFVAPTTAGEIEFYRWKGGSWVLLLTHPAERTPVLTTELVALSRLKAEFDRRDTKIIGLSVDSVAEQSRWRADVERITGVRMDYPLIADSAGSVSAKYGIVRSGSEPELFLRTLFMVDPEHVVRLTIAHPPSTGVCFDEVLRTLDALQLADRFGVSTPADWRPGKRVMVSPEVDDETAIERFGGFDTELPDVRYLDDPGATG